MKINKLLFFLLAVFSLNSCVEYVDNGTKPDGPEKPEEQKFTAIHSNPEEAKYIGDKFEFTAMLNSVDVTKSTKFKVNGTTMPSNSYTPVKTGSHTVIATMDNYTATFKFTVLDEEEEPEPTGNRIEYGGKSYPVSTNSWLIYFTSDGTNLVSKTINGVPHTAWVMYTGDNTTPATASNYILKLVWVPAKLVGTDYMVAYPNEVVGSSIVHDSGEVFVNGASLYDTTSLAFTIASSGNTFPTFDPSKFPLTATSNYSVVLTGASSGNSSELFWNGNHTISGVKASAKGKKSLNVKDIKPIKVSEQQIRNLKITK